MVRVSQIKISKLNIKRGYVEMNIKNLETVEEVLELEPESKIEWDCRSCGEYTTHEYTGDSETHETPQGEFLVEFAYVCKCEDGLEWINAGEVM